MTGKVEVAKDGVVVQEEFPELKPGDPEYIPGFDGPGDIGDIHFDSDFNVPDEYVPPPLTATGYYHGASTRVLFNRKDQAIAWTFTLRDNGGVMSDGKTLIDGSTYDYNIWLPKPGDEHKMTKTGKQTIRAAKISMMQQFANYMKINMDTPKKIAEALQNGDWMGLEADIFVEINEYEGRISNRIGKMPLRR
jgi:hypothetical protein